MDVSSVSQGVSWTSQTTAPSDQTRTNQSTSQTGTQAADDPWRETGQTYDVHAMTLQDMDDATMVLYQAGAITLFDRALLAFDPGQLTVNGQTVGDDVGWLTSADSEGNRDWVAEWEARLAQDENTGEAQNADNDRRILDILRRLEAGAAPALDRTV